MQLDAMLGKSSVGWANNNTETFEILFNSAICNFPYLDDATMGSLRKEKKPYLIPGASLIIKEK